MRVLAVVAVAVVSSVSWAKPLTCVGSFGHPVIMQIDTDEVPLKNLTVTHDRQTTKYQLQLLSKSSHTAVYVLENDKGEPVGVSAKSGLPATFRYVFAKQSVSLQDLWALQVINGRCR